MAHFTFQTAILLLALVAAVGWAAWCMRRAERRRRATLTAARRMEHDLEAAAAARGADQRDAAERLRAVIESAVDGIVVIDARGRIESFNHAAEQLFGYPASEVLGRNVSMLMPSPDHEGHDDYIARYLETGEAGIIGVGREVAGRRRDGTTFPLRLSVAAMTIGGERKFTGILHDISDRVRLETELRRSEARWRAVIESAVDGIIVIDQHGRIESFNAAAERLFGYAEREVIGENVHILMPSPYHEEHDLYLARYLATGQRRIIGTGRQVTGRRKDGTTFPLRLSVGEVTLAGERKFTGIVHDLSMRVEVEAKLREQAALARIGEMAAVIAHEVKNPLAGVRGAIQVIGSHLPADSTDAAMTKEIIARIDALDDLMKDMLLFARPPVPRLVPTGLGEVVGATVNLLRENPAFRHAVVEIEGEPAVVDADPALLKIVFENLLVNSAQAVQGHGTIRIRFETAGERIRVAVIDEGPGIPEEIRAKIFTPFFTTKARGTGLGLSTAKRLVEAQRGSITIDCPSGGGTSVTVELPVAQPPATV